MRKTKKESILRYNIHLDSFKTIGHHFLFILILKKTNNLLWEQRDLVILQKVFADRFLTLDTKVVYMRVGLIGTLILGHLPPCLRIIIGLQNIILLVTILEDMKHGSILVVDA